ncbi:MAG: glycosyltransferase family 4 protein [Candidatus Kaistia colombiensis]|nr:MAG: glycosyltransferase family 4 protein [Kaistia sp.]
MKKLLILCDDDKGGGTAHVARHLCIGLAKSFSVSFGYRRHEISDRYYSTLDSSSARVLDSRCAESNRFRSAYKSDEASGILDNERPDVILFVDAGVVYSHLALKVEATRRGIPYVIVVNGVPANARDMQRAILPSAIETLNAARRVVFVSAANQARFQHLFPDVRAPSMVIPNTCAEAFFTPPQSGTREQIRQDLGVTSNEFLILTTGRVEPKKGQELAIRALAELKKTKGSFLDIKLGFAGTATEEYAAKLKRLYDSLGLAGRVLMLGYRSDARELLAAADLFCLPSYTEGMPISIIEAMAMNVPVVATAVDGIPEQIDITSGVLVCPPAPKESDCIYQLAEAFERLRSTEAVRRGLATKAGERARTEFHPVLNIERYRQLLQPLQPLTEDETRNSIIGLSRHPLGRAPNGSVNFGSPEEAWKILDDGWGVSRRRGVWSEGNASSLTIPVRAAIESPLVSLRLEPHVKGLDKSQRLEIVIDGESLGTLTLSRKLVPWPTWVHLRLRPTRTDRNVRLELLYGDAAKNEIARRGRTILISRLHIADAGTMRARMVAQFLRNGPHLGPARSASLASPLG